MPRKRKSRIFEKHGKKWGDFRDLDGSRRPLVPPGEKYATEDPDVAIRLADEIVRQLERRKRGEYLGLGREIGLQTACAQRLQAVRDAESHDETYLSNQTRYLGRARDFFYELQHKQHGEAEELAARGVERGQRSLTSIGPPDVRAFMRWLKTVSNGRGGKQSQQSIRHHLSALSNVYAWAISEGHLPLLSNPVEALLNKPAVPPSRTPLREPWQLALLLESARTWDPTNDGMWGGQLPDDGIYERLAFFLYTGAREDEVRRADVQDLRFKGRLGPHVVIHGANKGKQRRPPEELERIVPMPPHLVEILQNYIRRTGRIAGPLFPGRNGKRFDNWYKALDRIAARVGWRSAQIRTRQFRVAYTTYRMTCDDVSANDVRLEVGHTSLKEMARVYARAQHLSERMGAELSYRVDRWASYIEPDQVAALQPGAGPYVPPAWERRTNTVREFVESVTGLSHREVERRTGIAYAVVVRVRKGHQSDVRGANLERMQRYLRKRRRSSAA